MCGFRVLLPRRRRRPLRKLRDSRKGRRGRRRRRFLTPLGAMLMKTHWSEGRELRRLRRLGARSNKLFVKKFVSPLPKLFRFFYRHRNASRYNKLGTRGSRLFVKTRILDAATDAARRQKHRVSAARAVLRDTGATLFTLLRNRRRRKQFFQRQKNISLALRRLRPALRRRKAGHDVRASLRSTVPDATGYVGRRFSYPQAELRTVSALYFQNPASKTVKSEAAKKRELEANVASKEARYKLTAQYIQNLTSFLPDLINYMISRKLVYSAEKISYSTARYLIRNIY